MVPGTDDTHRLDELVGFLARSLVRNPDAVAVEASESEGALFLRLRVAPDDLGRIIGRQGRTARALRTLLAAAALKQQRRALLEILD